MDAATRKTLDALMAEALPEVVALRRELHAHPQPCYEETYAAERVARWLSEAGVAHRDGIATTGVVGWIAPADRARAARPAVALRGDTDALPIQEETGLPWASTIPGFMHACGHDGHTALVAGAARVLARMADRLPRPVKFIFQPAEEGGAGALRMAEAGVLGPEFGGVDTAAIFALHARWNLPVGQIGLRDGVWAARADSMRLRIEGLGSHGCRPEDAHDPIVAAAAVVMNLQTIVSRNVRPLDAAVVSLGQIHGGTKSNIIPELVTLDGTVRTFDDAVAETVFRRIRDIAERTAAAFDCTARVDIAGGYPVGRNDSAATAYARRIAAAALGPTGVDEVPPTLGAEDFTYFAARAPSCFGWLGMRAAGRPDAGTHTPRFDFNDDALAAGLRYFCHLALAPDELE